MNKVKILIVEDEMVIAMNLVSILEDLGYEVLDPANSYEEAVESLTNDQPDIALLDIQLDGDKDGIDFARYIKQHQEIPFIYLTSNADSRTLNQAKETSPSSYLVKPFNQDDLFTSIEIALHNYRDKLSAEKKDNNVIIKDSIFVKNKNMFYKVKFEEILFIKSDHVYLEIYTAKNKKHLVRGSLTAFAERLPSNFFRTHRSYLINLDFLEAINSIHVIIKDIQVPIGKTYRNDLMASIQLE